MISDEVKVKYVGTRSLLTRCILLLIQFVTCTVTMKSESQVNMQSKYVSSLYLHFKSTHAVHSIQQLDKFSRI